MEASRAIEAARPANADVKLIGRVWGDDPSAIGAGHARRRRGRAADRGAHGDAAAWIVVAGGSEHLAEHDRLGRAVENILDAAEAAVSFAERASPVCEIGVVVLGEDVAPVAVVARGASGPGHRAIAADRRQVGDAHEFFDIDGAIRIVLGEGRPRHHDSHDLVVPCLLLHEGKDLRDVAIIANRIADARPHTGVEQVKELRVVRAGREPLLGAVEIEHGQRHLLDLVGAGTASGRFSCRLHRWQEQADQRADDGDDHQQLDQGKTPSSGTTGRHDTPAHRTRE